MNRQSVRTHFRRVGIVVSTMWSRGTGRFSLIVLGLWVLVSLVSLFWTPRSLWQTDQTQDLGTESLCGCHPQEYDRIRTGTCRYR